MEGKILAILLAIIVMVAAAAVLWLVLGGFLKFGTSISTLVLHKIWCDTTCANAPDVLKFAFCGGC